MKWIVGVFALLGVSGVATAEPSAGLKEKLKVKANMCSACHGSEGISSNPLWPNLAGQKKDYLAKQLAAFRSGERKDPLMSAMSATLSEEEVGDLATYFSELSPGK